MCDYSLHAITSRPAVAADKLISTKFRGTETRGLAAAGEPEVAVCVRPGTELAFDSEVTYRRAFGLLRGRTGQRLARFREINTGDPNTHHDALEFPDGKVVLVNDLTPGQTVVVLQVPNESPRVIEHEDASARRIRIATANEG